MEVSAFVLKAILLKVSPAFAKVSKLMDLATDATKSLTLIGNLEPVNALKVTTSLLDSAFLFSLTPTPLQSILPAMLLPSSTTSRRDACPAPTDVCLAPPAMPAPNAAQNILTAQSVNSALKFVVMANDSPSNAMTATT